VYGSIGASEPDNNNNQGGNEKKNTNSGDRNKRPTSTSRVVDALEIVKTRCLSLFVDQIGEPYAAIRIRDHIETIAIGSNRFKEWVIKVCYDYRKEEQLEQLRQKQVAAENNKLHSEQEGSAKPENEYGSSEVSSDFLSSVILLGNEDAAKILTVIKLEAEHAGDQKKLELRVAGNVDTEEDNYGHNIIYYDLNNNKGEIVKVTSTGWQIEKHGFGSNNSNNSNSNSSSFSAASVTVPLNILFKHYRNQLPQVSPLKEYPKDIFQQFMNYQNMTTLAKPPRGVVG
jgi:hypothetical protein